MGFVAGPPPPFLCRPSLSTTPIGTSTLRMVRGGALAAMAARAALFFLCVVGAVAAKGESKSFFDYESPVELLWRALKVALALSPLIAITLLFCCTQDDKEEEELRRKKKFDFSLDSGE